MTHTITIKRQVHFRNGQRGRKALRQEKNPVVQMRGSVPRISRLMALAIHMQELIDTGEVADYAELARLAHVSRARMTQIMNLNHLAPDIQEQLLYLPLSNGGRDAIRERMVRPITAVTDWRKQRRMWEEVKSMLDSSECLMSVSAPS